VGDDDQSIYGWRGAKIENIQRFSHDFVNTLMIRLEQNYRSTSTILQAANAVIANNQGRLGKELWTDGEKGEPIDLYAAFNEHDEARYVVDKIADLLREGDWRKSEIAILYRSNAQSRVLEEILLRSGMPYRIYGGQRFYDRLEIKHAMAYLRLLGNRNDDAAFERVVNTPTRGIGDKTIETLREFARDHGCSMWQAVKGVEQHQLLPNRAMQAVVAFAALIDQLEEAVMELPLEKLVEKTIERAGLIPFFQKEKGEIGQARIENLEELVNAAQQFIAEKDQDSSDLQQFLDSAALDAGEGQADEFEDSIQLMTLHSAKGLEFPLVFMVGVEENLFPHSMSADDPVRLEEERRLCYVGVTRAMQRLFISYAETRRLHGKDSYNKPSRFIREFPQELLREVRLKSSISRPVSRPGTNSFAVHKQEAAMEYGFRLGQRVRHEKFGEGVVLQFEGQDASARVQVNFAQHGSKWLVLQYARLQAI
jgi:DNA helicase-2/ATP-dependent DNA helicase PcrA